MPPWLLSLFHPLSDTALSKDTSHARGTPHPPSFPSGKVLARPNARDRSDRSIRSIDGGGNSLVGWRVATGERAGTRGLRNQRTRLFESIRGNREKIDRAMSRLRDATVRTVQREKRERSFFSPIRLAVRVPKVKLPVIVC